MHLERPVDAEVHLLDVGRVTVDQPACGAFPHNVVGVQGDCLVDGLGRLVVEMLLHESNVVGDGLLARTCGRGHFPSQGLAQLDTAGWVLLSARSYESAGRTVWSAVPQPTTRRRGRRNPSRPAMTRRRWRGPVTTRRAR